MDIKSNEIKPILISMLLCGEVIRDGPGKFTLKDVLFGIKPPQFPCVIDLCLHIVLTEVRAGMSISSKGVDAKSDKTIFETGEEDLPQTSPLMIIDHTINLKNLTFSGETTIIIHLLCNGSIIGQLPFEVLAA